MATHWETLDMIVSGRGRDPVLGDAFLARSGKPLSVDTAFEQALVLGPARVAEIAAKLAEVPEKIVRERYAQLHEAKSPARMCSRAALASPTRKCRLWMESSRIDSPSPATNRCRRYARV